MNKNILILVLLFILLISCKNNNKQQHPEIIKSNNKDSLIIEDYYPTGQLKMIAKLNNKTFIDTVLFYYKNGKTLKKGLTYNGKMYGWWYDYDSLGNLLKSNEYLILRDSIYNNQTIIYTHGKVNNQLSSYFILDIKDTLQKGVSYGKIKYNKNIQSIKDFIYVVIENRYPNGEIKKDTFTDLNFTPRFGVYFDRYGENRIKGFILHKFLAKDKHDTSIVYLKYHKKYFEKTVFVK